MNAVLPVSADDDKRLRVEQRLVQMFDLSRRLKYKDLADYFVYGGPDKKRAYKELVNPADPKEMRVVEKNTRRIKGYLDNSREYKILNFFTEKESEGEWCILEVRFKQPGNDKTVYFAFLEINGRYSLGDID
jgi:hypothetical protein